MHKIILTILIGTALSLTSCGHNVAKDTAARPFTNADSLLTVRAPADSSLTRRTDTVALRRDTSTSHGVNSVDSSSVRKDTTSYANQIGNPSAPEQKNSPPAENLLDPNGYKDTHWGMTLHDTEKFLVDHGDADDNDIREITNGFEYAGSLAGVSALFGYQFDNDRLFIVRLTPKVKAASKFDYLDAFDNYAAILEAKYGKPARSGFSKVDDSYLSTIESIQLGFAKKYVLWQFDRSYIVLVLVGRDKQLGIHITYVSRAIFDEMTSRIESLKLEDF